MTESLKSFMKGIIDYAGLFPPARLPLDISIRNYAEYRKEEEAWMLSRFIIPWSQLKELKPYHENLFEDGTPFDFSVLDSATETVRKFHQVTDEIMDACNQFHETHGSRVTTEILETKLPTEAAFSCDIDLLKNLFDDTAGKLDEFEYAPQCIFYETFFEENWKKDVESAFEAIALHNESASNQENYRYAGFKLRGGGVEADMFPGIEQVAFALNRAREYGVALKCTAGLHHPVRLFDESVQTRMHGFFNVFGGAMFAYAHHLNEDELQEILKEEDPERFIFTGESFSWNDYSVTTGQIEQLRKTAVISFGSCSFDEPREDLKKLGLL